MKTVVTLGRSWRSVFALMLAHGLTGLSTGATAAPVAAPPASTASAAPAAVATSSASPDVAAPSAVPTPVPAIPAAPPPQQVLAQLQNQLRAASDDKSLAMIGAQVAQIQAQAQQTVAARTADLAAVDQVLRRPAPRGRSSVAVAQRAVLADQASKRAQLQSALGQAQALETLASATFTQVAERRRESFSARVLEQSPSPLEPAFWANLRAASGHDLTRLEALASDALRTAIAAPEPRAGLSLLLGLILAALLVAPVRKRLERMAHRALVQHGRHGPFGGTAHAVLMTVVDTGVPIVAAVLVRLSASWGGLLSDGANSLAGAAIVAVGWAAAIVALGRALATDEDPNYRLLSMPDDIARRTGGLLSVVAVITAAGFLLSRLNYLVGASVAATIATNCVVSLAYAGVAGAILLSAASSGKTVDSGEGDAGTGAGSPAWTLVSLALGSAVLVTCASVFTGFTTLAVLISGQIFWFSVLAALAFLLLRFVGDLCSALFQPEGWAGRALHNLFRLRRSTVAQVGVLIAAGLQVIILVAAVSMALTPFGDSGRLLSAHVDHFGSVIKIGSATISPGAIVAGLGVLAVGLALAHLVRGWVVRRYLPATDWDAGVRNSVSTGVGYLGVGAAVLCSLSAMGLGFKQIALIASALSVGIGFGLQQVVQNFVSGLILLIERPVKVGDWVNVGGVEGDIRRIRVRATEIQMFDRTTVIVPNSDLITKQVQNKTLGDPRGRIELDISIANPADSPRATALILSIADGLEAILKDPKPAVFIDSLAPGGAVNFKVYLFVLTPRQAAKAKSDVYSAVLAAFQEANILFMGTGGPSNVIVEPGPILKGALDALQDRQLPQAKPPQESTAS